VRGVPWSWGGEGEGEGDVLGLGPRVADYRRTLGLVT